MNNIIKKFKQKRKTANARKWKHKEGGKAFITRVNVLDSNPKAYKYIKKKYRMAQQGTKLNFFQKAGNFLNSDLGKGILSLGSQIFNGIKTGADVAKFSNSFDSATDATVKAMESKMKADSYQKGLQKAQQVIAQKQQENPDIRFGEIDLRNMAQNFSNEFYDSDTIDNYKAQRAQEKLQSMRAIQGSAGNNWLDAIGGIAGNLLNGKIKNSTKESSSSGNSSYDGWTMNYNSQYGSKNNYSTFLQKPFLPKMNSVVSPNTSLLDNNATNFFKI